LPKPNKKPKKPFWAELNNIIKNTIEENEGFKFDGKTIIEQEFALNDQGILSLIILYNNRDDTFYNAKMEAPMNKIQGIIYDLYLK
jgi:hypothetical protein